MTKLIDFKIIRRSTSLAWPIALQSILTNMLAAIDIAMVSHLGDSAVGAVGLGNRFQFMILVVVLGIAWAVGILSAQYYGAGKTEKIRNTIALGAAVANTALLPIYILNLAFADRFIGLGTTNEMVIEQGQAYLWYTLPSLSFVAIILAYDNALRALNQVKTPMVLSIIALSLNILFNYWFINGGLGVQAMGVKGAALATSLARFIQLLLVLGYLRQKRHILSFVKSDFKNFFNIEAAKHFIGLAAPMMLGFALWSIGIFTYQIIYGRMGTQELAVMSTMAPIEAMFISLFFGLASACSILIGQCLGADRFEDARTCARSFIIFSPICAMATGGVVLCAQGLVLLPFSSLPASTLDTASSVLVVVVLSTWIKVLNMTIAMGILRAGGDNVIVTYIDSIGMWMVGIPLAATAAFYFDLPLIYVVAATYSEEIVKGVLFTWRARHGAWLRNLTR